MSVIEKAKILASSFIKDNMGFEVEPDDLMVEDVSFTGFELGSNIIHSVWLLCTTRKNIVMIYILILMLLK